MAEIIHIHMRDGSIPHTGLLKYQNELYYFKLSDIDVRVHQIVGNEDESLEEQNRNHQKSFINLENFVHSNKVNTNDEFPNVDELVKKNESLDKDENTDSESDESDNDESDIEDEKNGDINHSQNEETKKYLLFTIRDDKKILCDNYMKEYNEMNKLDTYQGTFFEKEDFGGGTYYISHKYNLDSLFDQQHNHDLVILESELDY